jgi:glycosyltransferase involved in cell wall biosynthesis
MVAGSAVTNRVKPGRRATKPIVVLDTRVVTGSGGGPEKTILNSPRFLEGTGYRMLCAYMHPPGDPGFEVLRRKAEDYRAPLLSVPDRGPLDWRVASRLLNVCRREKVMIWHGHDYKSNALGLLLRRFWKMRLVTTVHGWVKETRRTPLYYGIDKFCLPRYEKVICVSEDLYQQSLKCGVPPERCLLLENAIDVEEYARRVPVGEAKKKQGFAPERFTIGAVGRLSAEKGFDVLIRSVHRLLQSGLDVDLAIAGDGDQKEPLQALIAELGCQERVRLLGFVADTKALYQALDVFALSSYREGLPNVLLEAMALEVPVVATRVAGVPRLVRHEENGLLVEAGVGTELTDALARLAKDAALRDRLVRAGRRTIETDYSFAVRMDKMRRLYDDLLGRNGFTFHETRS